MVDAAEGVLGVEWIEGMSVRRLLPGGAEEKGDISEQGIESREDTESGDLEDLLKEYGISVGASIFLRASFFL